MASRAAYAHWIYNIKTDNQTASSYFTVVSGTGGTIVSPESGWEMLFCQRQVGTAQGVLSIAGLVYPMGPIVPCSFIIGPAVPSMAIRTLRLNTNVFTMYHCLLLCQVTYSKGCILDTCYYGAGIGLLRRLV